MHKGRVLRKNGGFTLVEVIVVLAIMAILAAFLVPSLIGYIDKAQDSTLIAECRQCVLAAQAIASDRYASGEIFSGNTEADADFKAAIKELAEAPAVSAIDFAKFSDAAVTGLSYANYGKTVIYKDQTYTFSEEGGFLGAQAACRLHGHQESCFFRRGKAKGN